MERKEQVKSKNIFKRVILPVVLGAVILGAGFLAGYFIPKTSGDKDLDALKFIIDNYREHYLFEEENVVKTFADAVLDDYSVYYTAEEYAALKNSDAGNAEGYGIVFTQKEGTPVVYSIIDNSPAFRAGLKKGDAVTAVAVGETNTPVYTVDDIINTVTGVDGATFFYTRGGNSSSVFIERKAYRKAYVRYYDASGTYGFSDETGEMRFVRLGDNEDYPVSDGGTAIVSLSEFSGKDSGLYGGEGQFAAVMDKFKADKKSKIIIDLRGNGGGFLDIMQNISRYFVCADNGSTPVVLKSENKKGAVTLYRADPVRYKEYGFEKIVFLADGNTASASEALIGAALDHDVSKICRVVVAGGGTFGKGIMQSTYLGADGSAIKLTTEKIFWPNSGICIHGVGITPETDLRVTAETEEGSAYYDGLEFCK